MLLNCGVGEDSWVPWTARRSNQSILKEISPEYSLEGLMLKLKLQYFGHLIGRSDSLEKTLMLGDWKQKGMTEDEMVGWNHWLDGHEFEQALGGGDGQGSLVCCSPWGPKESDMTERLNWILLRTGSDSSFHFWRSLFTLTNWSDTVEWADSEQLSGLTTQVSRIEELVTWQCFKWQESGMHCGSF